MCLFIINSDMRIIKNDLLNDFTKLKRNEKEMKKLFKTI